MNRTVAKGTADAAKYFKEEILDIMPDIPSDQLSDMVSSYVYYQQVDVTRDEAQIVVRNACPPAHSTLPSAPASPRRGW